MPKLYELCSHCGNNWMGCNCENYHPPLKVVKLEEGDVVIHDFEVKYLLHLFNTLGIHQSPTLKALTEKLLNSRKKEEDNEL